MNNPNGALNNFRDKFERQEWPTRQELRELLELCRHPRKNTREAALILLLHPPVANELAYYNRLFCEILASVPHINRLPLPVLELACDLLGFSKEIPNGAAFDRVVTRVLTHLPEPLLVKLVQAPLPLQPFLQRMSPRAITPRNKQVRGKFKRRWRLLRWAILRYSATAAAFELTWRDLKPLLLTNKSARDPFRPTAKGRWRKVGRNILLPATRVAAANFRTGRSKCLKDGSFLPASCDSAYFGGFGNLSLRYLDTLIQWQAKELASMKDFATLLSRQTGRVVLSWHNAGLAAAGGWAFASPAGQFPSDALRQEFTRAIAARMESMRTTQNQKRSGKRLFDLWEQRLVKPKVAHVLWESRLRAAFGRSLQRAFERDLRSAEAFLKDSEIKAICKGEIYGWHGAVCPHQRIEPDHILSWHGARKEIWQQGLDRLVAMIGEGQDLLTAGKISSFVLPWIDKFFISSQREGDYEYLPLLVEHLEVRGASPLILLWEDTSHGQAPSLQLTLKKLAAQNVPFRGIGIFDSNGSNRAQALQHIQNEQHKYRLFALRPYSDLHYPKSLYQLLRNRDYRFFRHYDSAWKDGLVFIYVGTQVFPLLSVQCDVETFPAWIAEDARKYPFGLYLRRRLREMILDEREAKHDRTSAEYAHWANLC